MSKDSVPRGYLPVAAIAFSITALIFLFVSQALAEKKVDTMTFDEAATGIEEVSVETINGDIEVSGTETSTIHIEAKRTVRGDDEAVIREFTEEFKPQIKRSGNRLTIETLWPEEDNKFDDEIENAAISYTITMPKALSVHAESVNGEVLVDDVYGDLGLETVNGSIDVDSESGIVKDISAESVNGEISVDVLSLLSDGRFETVNGEVNVSVSTELKGAISARSVNGSVTIKVPETASFSIDAEIGKGGSINTDWGDGEEGDREFGYEVNGGGEPIKVETLNGSVKVLKTKS